MPTYIVLLRGINITGHNVIRMADLAAHIAGCEATNVRTYIQSGNVVCEHGATTGKELREIVEEQLAGKLGYRVTAFVLSAKELAAIAGKNPFDVPSCSRACVKRGSGERLRRLTQPSSTRRRCCLRQPPLQPAPPEFGSRMYVCFFEKTPPAAAIAGIQPYVSAAERLVVKGSAGYAYYANGLGRAKLSYAVIERKLGPTTMRNWNTVTALLEMAGHL